jgi:cytoskeletal protein CcmA (bactofilin family)
MKHLKVIVLALLFGATPVVAWAGLAHAQTFSANTDEHRTVNSTLYSAGHTVDVRGTVNGDVFCAGETVTVNATVHGDVICAGQDITIKGHVDGDVRVAGQTVHIGAQVQRNLTLFAQTFTLDSDAKVGQDALVNGGTSDVQGSVGRDMILNSSDGTVMNTVGRNLRFSGDDLHIRSGATVHGDVQYTSTHDADISSLAHISGSTHHTVPDQSRRHGHRGMVVGFSLGFYLIALMLLGVTALVLVLLFPKPLHEVSGVIARSMGKTLLTGFLAGLAVPIAFFVLLFSLVGIPLAVILLLAWFLVLLLSGPVAAYYLGSMVLAKSKNSILMMMLGTFLLVTLYFVPVIGMLAMLVASWLGSGAILLMLKRRLPAPKYHVS